MSKNIHMPNDNIIFSKDRTVIGFETHTIVNDAVIATTTYTKKNGKYFVDVFDEHHGGGESRIYHKNMSDIAKTVFAAKTDSGVIQLIKNGELTEEFNNLYEKIEIPKPKLTVSVMFKRSQISIYSSL